MERANECLIFKKEGCDPRGKSDQRFFPVNSVVQLGSSIGLRFMDEVLNELFQNMVWILEKNDLFFFSHEIVPFIPSPSPSYQTHPFRESPLVCTGILRSPILGHRWPG